jgi:predicted RNase H-like nuclease (RuvC/YqgF family)
VEDLKFQLERCKQTLKKAREDRATAMASNTEVESLKNQLSNKEEEVRDLSSELSQLKQQLSLRVREEEGALTHRSLADEVALASDLRCNNILLVRPSSCHFSR